MKLYFMKQKAVDYMKANMESFYMKYYRENSNEWIYDLFDEDPFELFMDVPDFKLAPITIKLGEVDLENCKILYHNLLMLNESQASDERLWAGLCHNSFYSYIRLRWGYQKKDPTTPEKDSAVLVSRFFFSGGVRSGLYRNTISKYWWVGHNTYRENGQNKFEMLDALGPDDLATKINDLFYSNNFAANPTITQGICKGWKIFRDHGISLPVREYFRPALQYMNALGGGILLDILTEEEIKTIFYEYLYQLYSQDKPSPIVIDSTLQPQEEDIWESDPEEGPTSSGKDIARMKEQNNGSKAEFPKEYSEMDITDVKHEVGERSTSEEDARLLTRTIGKPNKVSYGCRVKIYIKERDRMLLYNIPKDDNTGKWYPIMRSFMNKTIGESILFRDENYVISDIGW